MAGTSLAEKLQSFKDIQAEEDEELRDLTTFSDLDISEQIRDDREAQLYFNEVCIDGSEKNINSAIIDIAKYKGIELTDTNLAKLKQDLIEQKLLNTGR